ncbi:hypothetical protein, partial [Bacillus pseudomycoides]|uniref:hypothetical protein n=1 Tax=Bacillus pseudomycoides TaxID=64104 RepID=UPI002FFE0722
FSIFLLRINFDMTRKICGRIVGKKHLAKVCLNLALCCFFVSTKETNINEETCGPRHDPPGIYEK